MSEVLLMRKALVELEVEEGSLSDLSEEEVKSRIKRAFHKLALRYHPDKRKGDKDGEAGAEDDKFKRISAAYELLCESREKRLKRLLDEEDADDFDFEGYCEGYAFEESELVRLFKAALLGNDVEAELRAKGVHRPPVHFGISPFPPFDAQEGGHGHNSVITMPPSSHASGLPEDDCKEEFLQRVRASLSQASTTEALDALGVKETAITRFEGDFSLVKRYKKGVEVKYPLFELSITISFSLSYDAADRSKTVRGLRIEIPYFGEDSEVDTVELSIGFPTKKAELLSMKRNMQEMRSKLKSIVLPLLLLTVEGMTK
ncbi:hypothetical protein HOP50_17g79580 [Chloropicon primus]|uniref:J domain-containing protein n=1 Tax=Chloropicon primus TaxID=1764295 RepID=A0A5B8MXX6_9CHLO|nr:hypothetical protein A3770_17p79350 [Chloropicon primus]UPR04614.1 hypothetical protein HOP50_17g79580 [Chloropicon primus]|mmetsp:Transcript_14180/g.40192  ORF Transcript_14180/g.40192 Transcript_14180/m.40192 type:complete len:316 (-) Transcript_14180:99-1046(-)|eukprot:QDZ25417.1 hypothetical protein A3770_17p79350 [Chloropicon primus]